MTDLKNDYLDIFHNLNNAYHHALWLNFKYRIAKITFGVIEYKGSWAVLEEATAKEMKVEFLDILPKDLSEMNYNNIRRIRMGKNPLPHLEEIFGMISTMDGEVLRYILHAKIPLEKIIRFELAGRGFDKNHRWCGFDKANDVWLK